MDTAKNILNGNKLIAEFMGAKWWPKTKSLFIKYSEAYEFEDSKIAFGVDQLQYHQSFDWLVPVHKKIYLGTDYAEKMDSLTRKFDYWEIEKLWKACVDFIKWYNAKNKEDAS